MLSLLLYRIISFQPFNIVVKPANFYCFYINQQDFYENSADFSEKPNALEHFHSFSSSTNNKSLLKEFNQKARKIVKMQNNLKLRKNTYV